MTQNIQPPPNESVRPYRSTLFRTPHQCERELGLWVDRIGRHLERKRHVPSRLLGLYAAVLIRSGEGTFDSPPTGLQPLTAGDVFFLFPEIPHTYSPNESWDSLCIVWDGPDARRLEKLGYLQPEHPIIHGAMDLFEAAHQRLNILIHEEDQASMFERKLITEKLILDMYSLFQAKDVRLSEAKLIQKAIGYIQTHAKDACGIPEIAQRFDISPRRFQRLCKKYTGRNPLDMMMSFRISHAKTLLLHGATVKEAAAQSGHTDMFYFIRVFKKFTGESPGKWQKKQIQQHI